MVAVVSLDVRGQRHMADGVDRPLDGELLLAPEPNDAPAVKSALEDLAVQRDRPLEHDPGAWLQLLPRMHERFPPIIVDRRDEQTLHRAAARYAAAAKPRGKHSSV